jgi:signal transduction histidine kinase
MSKILLIEDDASLRFMLEERLRVEGYEVEAAEDGEEGVQKAKANPPDLVLCDIMMPKMDGYQVMSALQRDVHLAELPVILLTALTQVAQVRNGMNLGADDYLIKPVEKNDLLQSIRARLARRDQSQQRQEQHVNHIVKSLAGMMHDLRNSLMVIGMCVQMSKDEGDSPKPLPASLQGVVRSIGNIDRQIQCIMRFARARFQHLPFQPVPVSLPLFCEKLVAEFPENKQVEIEVDGVLPPCKICADPVHLHNVLSNLLSNAVKYSPPDQPVRLRLETFPDNVVFTVCDSGIGIPAEALPHVFEPFYRATNVKSRKGIGLGLAMTKLLVEKHGGTITVHSQVGKGSEFRVVWPKGGGTELQGKPRAARSMRVA